MPSMRPSAPNARGRAAKGEASGPSATAPTAAQAASEDDDDAAAGGFHESSYELRHGLEISESEWPLDVTVPGALGDR